MATQKGKNIFCVYYLASNEYFRFANLICVLKLCIGEMSFEANSNTSKSIGQARSGDKEKD